MTQCTRRLPTADLETATAQARQRRDAITDRVVLPAVPEDASEQQRVAQGGSGVLDELDLLVADLRRVELHECASRVTVARAIVFKELREVICG